MSGSEWLTLCGGSVQQTPVLTLLSAHRDIRIQTRAMWTLADLSCHDQVTISHSAARASLCLGRGLRIHRWDEERSVFPRLEQAFPRLTAAIRQVHEQHEVEEESVSIVAALCARLSIDPASFTSIRDELRLAVRHLTVSLETHMSLEERQLFPALVHLPAEMQNSILLEMRRRRNGSGSAFNQGSSS